MKFWKTFCRRLGSIFYKVVGPGAVIVALGMVLGMSQSVSCKETVIGFVDPELEAVVREALSKPVGDFSASEVAQIVKLNAPSRLIRRLDGIEYLIGLETLDLSYNLFTDISPLAGLGQLKKLNLAYNQVVDYLILSRITTLKSLDLHQNRIQDIAFVAGLSSLEKLDFSQNRIEDISALARLVALRDLNLAVNQIVDISPLSSLTSLRKLGLGHNRISDVSPLVPLGQLMVLGLHNNQIHNISSLTELRSLHTINLRGNQIVDMLALVHNKGLGQGDEVDVGNNPLGSVTHSIQIPSLKLRGIRIWSSVGNQSF